MLRTYINAQTIYKLLLIINQYKIISLMYSDMSLKDA